MKEAKSIQNQTQISVLDSVSDEYLRKKKRNKKIAFSCISAVIFILAVVIIVLACIRIDLKPYFLSDPTTVTIQTSEGTYEVTPDDANYDRYNEIYQNSFNSSVLTSLFTGNLGSYSIDYVERSKFYADDENKTGIASSSSISEGTFLAEYLTDNYVHLHYFVPQALMNADGSHYTTPFSTTRGEVFYNDVYFNISDSDGEQDLTFYFGGYYGENRARIYTITIRANTFDLYQLAIGE